MTIRSGRDAREQRGGGAGGGDRARRPYVDRGWDDYWPEDSTAGAKPRSRREALESRDYHSTKAGSLGARLRFLLFAGVLIALVLGGLYSFVRPPVLRAIADWGAENPTALELPFVSDIVRGELGSSLTQPADATDFKTQTFQVQYGDTTADIGQNLESAGLIADRRAFVYEAIERGVTADFLTGYYQLAPSMTVDQIIDILTTQASPQQTVRLTFREGLRIEQMVAKLEYLEANPADPSVVLKMDVQAYYEMAKSPPADLLAEYPWLKLPQGASLEGFLFPATYDVDPNITPRQLLELQLNAFEKQANSIGLLAMKPEDIYKTVQVASLVELEATLDTDRPLVAGVYLNRLDPKAWPTLLLNSNPTVNYANDSVWLESHPIESWVDYTFWNPVTGSTPMSQLSFPEDIAPYNTYHHKGLPPTPICSPGADSLDAAANPDTKDGYFYFVAKNDGTGGLAFAKTLAEQNANLKKYGYIP
jgi:UPF0755 protein